MEKSASENIELLVSDIKKKRELQGISESIIKEKLLSYLKQNPKLNLENKRSSDYKKVIKEVRATLRRQYGLFREEKITEDFTNIQKMLLSHSSTKERLPFYPELYKQIFQITGNPTSIIDLACGINPLSLEFMGPDKLRYYAYDISEKEIALLNKYFSWKNKSNRAFNGLAQVLDISNVDSVKKVPKADLCFLFKIVDILDQGKGHKKSEEVIKAVPTRFVVVSFATATMSGKPMTAPRRRWMEWLCKRLGYSYEILEFSNEIFYVVRKD